MGAGSANQGWGRHYRCEGWDDIMPLIHRKREYRARIVNSSIIKEEGKSVITSFLTLPRIAQAPTRRPPYLQLSTQGCGS